MHGFINMIYGNDCRALGPSRRIMSYPWYKKIHSCTAAGHPAN